MFLWYNGTCVSLVDWNCAHDAGSNSTSDLNMYHTAFAKISTVYIMDVFSMAAMDVHDENGKITI